MGSIHTQEGGETDAGVEHQGGTRNHWSGKANTDGAKTTEMKCERTKQHREYKIN